VLVSLISFKSYYVHGGCSKHKQKEKFLNKHGGTWQNVHTKNDSVLQRYFIF